MPATNPCQIASRVECEDTSSSRSRGRHVHRYGRGRDVCVRKRVSAAVLVQYTRWIAKQENREAGVKLNNTKEAFCFFVFVVVKQFVIIFIHYYIIAEGNFCIKQLPLVNNKTK